MTRTWNSLERVVDHLEEAFDDSVFGSSVRNVSSTVRGWSDGSRLVGRVTREPESQVREIELRDTVLLGPVITRVENATGSLPGRIHATLSSSIVTSAMSDRRIDSLWLAGVVVLVVSLFGLVSAVVFNRPGGGWLLSCGLALLVLTERRAARRR